MKRLPGGSLFPYIRTLLAIGIDGLFDLLGDFRLGCGHRNLLDAGNLLQRLGRHFGGRARHGVETRFRGLNILAWHHVHRADRMLQQAQDAEEVVQETYLKIWKEAASYESDGKPMAWVFTIARNYCYMSLRKRQRLSEESFEELQEQEGKEEPGELCQELELAPERQTLLDALMQLNEKERQIVLLHKVSGMKHREIAEMFQMPISTVLSVYHRAMKKLWERIEKSS